MYLRQVWDAVTASASHRAKEPTVLICPAIIHRDIAISIEYIRESSFVPIDHHATYYTLLGPHVPPSSSDHSIQRDQSFASMGRLTTLSIYIRSLMPAITMGRPSGSPSLHLNPAELSRRLRSVEPGFVIGTADHISDCLGFDVTRRQLARLTAGRREAGGGS